MCIDARRHQLKLVAELIKILTRIQDKSIPDKLGQLSTNALTPSKPILLQYDKFIATIW